MGGEGVEIQPGHRFIHTYIHTYSHSVNFPGSDLVLYQCFEDYSNATSYVLFKQSFDFMPTLTNINNVNAHALSNF